MAIIARWAGDGLAAGTVFDDGVVGTGDLGFESVTSTAGTFVMQDSGLYPPRIAMVQQSGATAQFLWQNNLGTIGPFPQHAVRWYNEFTAYPTGGNAQLVSVRNVANAIFWWMDMTPTGILRLRKTDGTSVAVSNAPIPLSQELRLSAVADGDAVSVYVYKGESLSPIQVLAGTGFDTTIDSAQFRFGNPNSAPLWPLTYWDNMALDDTATRIGPHVPPPPSNWSMWDGTQEVTINIAGMWDGAALVDLNTTSEIA